MLTEDQAAIVAFIATHVDTNDEIKTLELRLSGDGSPFRAAVFAIGVDDSGRNIVLVVNLPARTLGLFLALTAGRQEEVARILANLEQYERETGHSLLPLETVVTDGPDEIKALLLLRTASHPNLAKLPSEAKLDSRTLRLSLVTGIDAAEYAYKSAHGTNQLLDLLDASGKSMLMFDQAAMGRNPLIQRS